MGLQYITIKHLNQKLDSYQFSLTAATQSRARAAAEYREKSFDRALQLGINYGTHSGLDINNNNVNNSPLQGLPLSTKTTLMAVEKDFLMKGALILEDIHGL